MLAVASGRRKRSNAAALCKRQHRCHAFLRIDVVVSSGLGAGMETFVPSRHTLAPLMFGKR